MQVSNGTAVSYRQVAAGELPGRTGRLERETRNEGGVADVLRS